VSRGIDVLDPRRVGAGLTRFTVRVDEHSYDVGVGEDDLTDLAGGAAAEELVRESFRFLLKREPPEAILHRFDLGVIAGYFPEYPSEIRRRMRRGAAGG
jgi:hypothetical protein